jgi:hypothetical protein
MTVEKYLELWEFCSSNTDKASDHLQSICHPHRNEMGLVSDEFRKTEEYIKANRDYKIAFSMLRELNGSVSNKMKREAALLRRNNKMNNKLKN